jgi:hypothetical protein
VFVGAGGAIFIALWDGSTDLGLIGFLASAYNDPVYRRRRRERARVYPHYPRPGG